MIEFPLIYPTRIKSLQMPEYRTSITSWKSGDTNRKRTQFAGSSTRLVLEYKMISDSELDTLINIWDTTEGVEAFTLPSNFYKSYPNQFVNAINNLNQNFKQPVSHINIFWLIESTPVYEPKILCGNADNVRFFNRYDLDLNLISCIS